MRLLDVGHHYPQTVRNRDHEMTELYNFIEIIVLCLYGILIVFPFLLSN